MDKLPDPKEPVPATLKTHNGMLHALAMSDDPAIKCQNVVKLVNNLKVTVMVAGLNEHQIVTRMFIPQVKQFVSCRATMGRFLDYQLLGANKAWQLYSSGKSGYAVQVADMVLGEIMFLIYDKRFTTEEATALFNKDKGMVKT